MSWTRNGSTLSRRVHGRPNGMSTRVPSTRPGPSFPVPAREKCFGPFKPKGNFLTSLDPGDLLSWVRYNWQWIGLRQ